MTNVFNKRGATAPLLGSKITLKIEKLAIGGAGVARHHGFVVFVPLVAPQDEIIAEITLVKKNFAEGRLLEVLKPGPSRRKMPCPVAQECGGCNWQQITESEQQKQKESLVFETLRRFLPEVSFEYLPIKISPRSWRYRNRIQPKFKNNKFGFFARGSHEIVDLRDCLITEEGLTAKFAEVRAWAQKRNTSELQRLELYLSEDSIIHYNSITEDDDGIGFSQVNRFQNQDLIDTVLGWSEDDQLYSAIYDLYAGAGNFTFPLAEKHKNSMVRGVELNTKLVNRALSKINNSRIQFTASDVERFMADSQICASDLVLLDPPRAGASEQIMRKIAQSRPRKIIYISCHPVSLARDLRWLLESANKCGVKMRLQRVQAFEMFPQTDHVETIAELRVDS